MGLLSSSSKSKQLSVGQTSDNQTDGAGSGITTSAGNLVNSWIKLDLEQNGVSAGHLQEILTQSAIINAQVTEAQIAARTREDDNNTEIALVATGGQTPLSKTISSFALPAILVGVAYFYFKD